MQETNKSDFIRARSDEHKEERMLKLRKRQHLFLKMSLTQKLLSQRLPKSLAGRGRIFTSTLPQKKKSFWKLQATK